MANEILIVGAGPTGLILACELLTLGVPCRVIDRLAQPVHTSRSFTIHARTLELLDKLDLADEFVRCGHKAYSMDYHFAGTDVVSKIDFRELDSDYPYCLIINQQDTEAIIRQKLFELGGKIEWNVKLENVEQSDDGEVTVELLHIETDETEIVHPEWLIGCDGVHSTVRRNLNLPFDGEEYAGEMKMMDVALEGYPLSTESISYFVSREHMLLISKLPGENYRVLISDTGQGATTQTARDDFQRVVDLHFKGDVQLGEPEWTTVFKISRRKTDNYRVGQILLAGDAAHVNSPAGGQGMNVSMQDAFNLAWKMALVIKAEAPTSLVDSYAVERLPIAKQMHEGTQFLHSIIMAHGKGIEERIALTQAEGWNKRAASQISGIAYTYRAPDADGKLVAGDRAPDVHFGEDQHLYDFIDRGQLTVFALIADGDDPHTAIEGLQQLGEHFPVSTQIIATTQINSDSIVDSNGAILQTYGARYVVLRPDRYVEAVADNVDAIAEHLEAVFVDT